MLSKRSQTQKRTNSILFHLYEHAKQIYSIRNYRVGQEGGLYWREQRRGFWSVGYTYYLDVGGGYRIYLLCKNPSTYTLKMHAVYKMYVIIHLQK